MRKRKEVDITVASMIGFTILIVHWHLRTSPLTLIACGIAAFFVYRAIAYLVTRTGPEAARIRDGGTYDDDGVAPKSASIRQMCFITTALVAVVIFNGIVGRGPQVGGQEWWFSIGSAAGGLARLWYTAAHDHPVSGPACDRDPAAHSS
jgi:hypothetical protein